MNNYLNRNNKFHKLCIDQRFDFDKRWMIMHDFTVTSIARMSETGKHSVVLTRSQNIRLNDK